MKPKACHTTIKTGAKALAILRDGTQVIGKFIERKGRYVVLDTTRINVADLRSLGYYKEKPHG